MNEEGLIEAVRKHQELYDTRHVNYMKTRLKNEIWSDIAKKLNLKDGEETKQIWLKLRACYRDARRRYQKYLKDGIAAEKIKLWRYQNHMSFLEPFMLNGLQEKNENEESEANDDSRSLPDNTTNGLEGIDSELDYHEKEELTTASSVTDNLELTYSGIKGKNTKVLSSSITNSNTPINTKKKKQCNDEILSVLNYSLQLREKRKRKREEERRELLKEKRDTDDPLYNFFMSMYQLTKAMPPQHQHSVRAQIFQAISDAESNIINNSVYQQPEAYSISNNSSLSNGLFQKLHEVQIKQEQSSESLILIGEESG